MADILTPQQRQAVYDRGGELLISAAAGSGKTKVLVDRLISYLMDPVSPANIDDFLIITYTKAAASELREKIAAKLNEKIAEFPENTHLHRQLQRLYLTTISTVHSFCSEVLRQYAYMLDLPSDFSVMDDREAKQLRLSAMEQVLDQAYSAEEPDMDFYAFVDSQSFHRNDGLIPELVIKASERALCHLQPDSWMDQCIAQAQVDDISDACQTVWGEYLLKDLHETVDYEISALSKLVSQIDLQEVPEDFASAKAVLSDIIIQLERLRNSQTWDEIVSASHIDYGRLSFKGTAKASALSEDIKLIKAFAKKTLDKKLGVFAGSNAQVLEDLRQSYRAVKGLIGLVRSLHSTYGKMKRRIRALDYSDLEHFTLDLLYGKSRTGITAVAKELGNRYREIMVDEYQDSNAIQEGIFAALTQKRHNLFLVGDVKQSIYQFRLANPEIFLDKYNRFLPAAMAQEGQGRKVLLSSNFRSGAGILDAANDVFQRCMTQKICGLDYGEEEMLRPGVSSRIPLPEPEIQFIGLKTKDESNLQEAKMVAKRIQKLLDGTHMVRNGKENALRPVQAEDIVILLRSPGSQGFAFKQELEALGISCDDNAEDNLFDADEIFVLRSILTVISNPRQDIPLVAALSSPVFGYNANDLSNLRQIDRYSSIYEALLKSKDEKAERFFAVLQQLRKDAKTTTISGLLEKIYLHTKLDAIYSAMPDGPKRLDRLEQFYALALDFDSRNGANLEQFLADLEVMEQSGIKLPATPKSNAVRIYSIHKSKGLEFPIVFLCGLSKMFNTRDLTQKVLLDKDLGIGLCCADQPGRQTYPPVAKSAIAAKMLRDLRAEEMRILYVAMTRPVDRLIMTYTFSSEDTVTDMIVKSRYYDSNAIHGSAKTLLSWVLYTALHHTEAGALHTLAQMKPDHTEIGDPVWDIQVTEPDAQDEAQAVGSFTDVSKETVDIEAIHRALRFQYSHEEATRTPSKQTATQLKERDKDREVADKTPAKSFFTGWRKPSFVDTKAGSIQKGNAIHAVMQYVDFSKCASEQALSAELNRLEHAGMISAEDIALVDPQRILALFQSDLGKTIAASKQVLREFKFSVLVDSGLGDGDKILLQGVVDCAVIDEKGIRVIDFKSDRVTQDTLAEKTAEYKGQVDAYAQALTQIFSLPVTEKWLYFFNLNQAGAL